MTEHPYTPDCIRTYTGKYFNVFDPDAELIDIRDIAHALAYQPRFGGHTPSFYSVAQHCCYVAKDLPAGERLAGLLHDASKAYLPDIPSPIRKRLPDYKKLEESLMKAIADRFGFAYPLSEEIKKMDREWLKIEQDSIMTPKYPVDYVCWNPGYARAVFMDRFERYSQ